MAASPAAGGEQGTPVPDTSVPVTARTWNQIDQYRAVGRKP